MQIASNPWAVSLFLPIWKKKTSRVYLINDYSSPKFDRKQGTKYSEQYLKKKLSYSNVSPKE